MLQHETLSATRVCFVVVTLTARRRNSSGQKAPRRGRRRNVSLRPAFPSTSKEVGTIPSPPTGCIIIKILMKREPVRKFGVFDLELVVIV